MTQVLGCVRGARAQIKAAREILGVERMPEKGAAADEGGRQQEWSVTLRCADAETATTMQRQAALVGARSGRSVGVRVVLDREDREGPDGNGIGAGRELSTAVGERLRGACVHGIAMRACSARDQASATRLTD